MKKARKYFLFVIPFVLALAFTLSGIAGITTATVAYAADKTTYTRQGDTVWFGYYPQTKATDEELSKMSATADENGYFTSGKDKFVKVTSANPQFHSETADTDYIPFDDDSQPVPGATYYFKMEPIEWKVMVDDADKNAVKLVSKKYLDTHFWLSADNVRESGWAKYNVAEGVPADTSASSWRYSEIRAWLNDGFLNVAVSADEQKSLYVFANVNTIDYREDDPDTVVNDYVAVGDRSDYDAAGNDGRPTDYAIVKGATWCYNKDHIYYWVNSLYSTFGSGYVRLYRHDEHEKVAAVDSVEAVRPIIYVKRGDAKILATVTQQAQKQSNLLLIFGIILAIVGAGAVVPMMVITSARYKKLPAEQKKGKFPYKKHEVPLIACGLVLLIGGLLMIILPIAINGGGIGGGTLQPGIYVQQGSYGGGQLGSTAFRLNADGTYNHTGYYDGNSTVWDNGGTWSQSGSKVTFVAKGNPMTPAGYTVTATIYDGGSSFGNSSERFKRVS